MEQAWTVRRRDSERVQCPLCHDALADDGASLTECADCSAVHHAECWTDLERCAACAGARGRAPAVVAPAPPPQAPQGCEQAGCRRLAVVDPHRGRPRSPGQGGEPPARCEPHGAQALGFGLVVVSGMLCVMFEGIAWIGAMDPTDRRFPMSWGLACFYYGMPTAMLAWGLLTLLWGVLAERTEPNEPVAKLSAVRARARS